MVLRSNKTTLLEKDNYSRTRFFSYEDSLFAINLSPLLGYSYGKNDKEKQTHLWKRFSIYGYLSDHIGYSFNFKDNSENGNNVDRKKQFTPITGITDIEPKNTSLKYSDQLEFLYLFPLSSFRIADQYFSNQNRNAGAQTNFFISFSSRNHIPQTHLFTTLFMNEVALSDIGDSKEVRPQLGFVFGASVTDLPINNLTIKINYTRINPFAYQYHIPTLTYESRGYVLGHWMQHNSDQIYLSLNYRIFRGLQTKVWTEYIRKGGEGIADDQFARSPQPFLFGQRTKYTNWGLNAKYEITHEAFISLDFKSFHTSKEQDNVAFVDIRHNEFFISMNYGL